MKILIAVVNARSRQSTWAQAVRDTWKPRVTQADVFFFVGRGSGTVPDDTVVLDCDDSYEGLPDKVREIIRWAYDHGYDFVLKCDDDVVLDPPKMFASGFEKYEYTGRANRQPTSECPFWIPMGFNYWLSRKCMEILKDATLPEHGNDDERWVATKLYFAGIRLHDDTRYRLKYGYKLPNMRRPIRIKRPPKAIPHDEEPNVGSFSWCIFLEGGSGNTISLSLKLSEFHRVFKEFTKTHENPHSCS